MNLGNILKQAGGTPLTGKKVAFQILCKDRQGNPLHKTCEALLLPIGEAERVCAPAAAQAWREANHDHAGSLADELRLQQLALILHDPDNPRAKFVRAEDFEAFRAGLTFPQVEWLLSEYAAHLRDEYPELAGPGDLEKMGDQAEGFTPPAPGQPSGS